MTEKNISKKLLCVKKMPPLKHKKENEPFDIMKSEVAQWLVQQPEVLQWICDHIKDMKHHDKELLIKYNQETGTWQGIDYENEN